ncbi:ester cyclase [Salinirubellus salinus]|uniref:Ester cyclase n=1 Tax=Salinirubellus salinus TaxID=1364945 RepID=A0A9E7R5J1_9EURY|nr:ester cyclase [Salinirubellus salinus]UWM56300.1 ester cyclase [Salinirubellus salinus]
MGVSDTPLDDPVAHYEGYATAWNDHDAERVLAHFAPDVRYDDPATDGVYEYDDLEPFVRELLDGFPDVHFEPTRIMETREPGVLVVQWTMTGTQTGTYEGLPPTDEHVEVDGIERVVVTEDGIAEVRGYFDNHEFTAQLGLTFPEVVGKLPKLAVGAVRNAL